MLRQILSTAIQSGLPRVDAQMLILHAMGKDPLDRAWLLVHDTDLPTPDEYHAIGQLLTRRLAGEPVAYITGFKEFFGLRLFVTQGVLDPRDDTETLVQWALDCVPADQACAVLDLGTGSGAVALAIKAHRPCADVWATEVSTQAREVASHNAKQLGLPLRLLPQGSTPAQWFTDLGQKRFHLIVSNPPYICEDDPHLAALAHEPVLALTSGADGLNAIRSIVAGAKGHLLAGGWLVIEHGLDQAAAVQALFTAHGFQQVSTRQDLAGLDRCTGGQHRPAAQTVSEG